MLSDVMGGRIAVMKQTSITPKKKRLVKRTLVKLNNEGSYLFLQEFR